MPGMQLSFDLLPFAFIRTCPSLMSSFVQVPKCPSASLQVPKSSIWPTLITMGSPTLAMLVAWLSMALPITGRIIEVRCVRPNNTESVVNFEHHHVNNANVILASAGLAPVSHTIAFVMAQVGGAPLVLGDASSMDAVVSILDANTEINSITVHVSINGTAAGAHAAGITHSMHHTAHGGASSNFGVAGSSTPMNVHPHMPQMGMGMGMGMGAHSGMPSPMVQLGYGMPVDQAGQYISGRKAKFSAGRGKSLASPGDEDPSKKKENNYTFHLSGEMDKHKKKKTGSESYKAKLPSNSPAPAALSLP